MGLEDPTHGDGSPSTSTDAQPGFASWIPVDAPNATERAHYLGCALKIYPRSGGLWAWACGPPRGDVVGGACGGPVAARRAAERAAQEDEARSILRAARVSGPPRREEASDSALQIILTIGPDGPRWFWSVIGTGEDSGNTGIVADGRIPIYADGDGEPRPTLVEAIEQVAKDIREARS